MKKTMLVGIFFWCLLMVGCQAEFDADKIDPTKVDMSDIDALIEEAEQVSAMDGFDEDDFEIELKAIKIVQSVSNQQGDSYKMLVGITAEYDGEGSGQFEEVFDMALYNADTEELYMPNPEINNMLGSDDYRNKSIEEEKTTYAEFEFIADGWTFDPEQTRFFLNVSNEIYEFTDISEFMDEQAW